MRRVVITGLGLVTPLGCGVPSVWSSIQKGRSGIQKLTGDEYKKLPCSVAGLVPTDPNLGGVNLESKFSESERRSFSKGIMYALLATEEALNFCNLNPKGLSEELLLKIGVTIGMGMPDLQDIVDTNRLLTEKGYSRVSPYFMPRILPNLASGQISIKYGLQGPNHCVSTACASACHAIGDAFQMIRNGQADVMVCGGTESSVNPLTIAAFSRLRALSTKFNNTPETASRPFDTDRDGFVMSEGAGILILEDLEFAKSRKAPVLGEVLGYGLSGDAHHLTSARVDGVGAFRAMQNALRSANVLENEIRYINCHATSTPIGDKAEITALRSLFKSDDVQGIPISSTKGAHGHLLGAAGSVEAAIALIALKNRIAPPCNNLLSVDSDFQSLNLVTSARPVHFDTTDRLIFIKNSFGFGGTNASLCIEAM